jgi:NAD(P)-dependent dehydrogenase (short-subunit alcohol dehydrogenase family)
VLVADLDAERGAGVAGEIDGAHVVCDVADAASVEAAVAAAGALGTLRIAVDCAGIATPTKLVRKGQATPLEDFAKVIAVNLLGTINVLRCAAAAMALAEPAPDGDRGVCVTTASIAAYEGQVGQVAYAASKAGVAGLTLPVARELAASAIRVVAIAPGLFDTPLLAGLPAGAREALAGSIPYPQRLGDPAEYAALVEHIVANTMLNGETIRLDGALRMGPA